MSDQIKNNRQAAFKLKTELIGLITFRKLNDIAYRGIELASALACVVIMAIPMALITVAIKATSPGPIFFKQTRFGKNSRPFTIIKFRTMYVDAPEKSFKTYSKQEKKKFVSPIGKFLRHTSLDELPQLFNVIGGTMSFVGPRPLAITDEYVIKLRIQSGADMVRPGITGLAQIHGRNNISDETKAEYDHEYVKKHSAILDLKIMLRSVIVVIGQTGINGKSN